MIKCVKCHNSFREEWKILQNKSELEKQFFLKNYRMSPCPHSNSTVPHISKKLSFDNDLPKSKIVELPKSKIVELPKSKIVVPDPLKVNRIMGLPNNMNAKDYHDFLMGR